MHVYVYLCTCNMYMYILLMYIYIYTVYDISYACMTAMIPRPAKPLSRDAAAAKARIFSGGTPGLPWQGTGAPGPCQRR